MAHGTLCRFSGDQKKIDLHILMPCKPIACPPSMKQPIAKLTVITIFALHPLSTGPRAYGTCIVHLACHQASRMQQERMLLLLCSPSASTCTKQMHSTLTSCIDNEPTMRCRRCTLALLLICQFYPSFCYALPICLQGTYCRMKSSRSGFPR